MDTVELTTPPLDLASAYATTSVPVCAPHDLVDHVRAQLVGHTYESVTDIVVCTDGRLLGLVTIERLLGAAGELRVAEIMDDTPPVVAPGTDQEVAAWHMVHQNESSLAVIDAEGRFLGLIPPFRMLAVLLQEHDEDLARLGGFLHDSASARTASAEPVGRRLRHRLPWLLVGLAGAMVAAVIVSSFEHDLERNVMLAFFVPGIVYMADAVGTQTEALVIRGLSVGVPIPSVAWREAVTGVLIGSALASVFFVFTVAAWQEVDLALAVSLSLLISASFATVIAVGLPWLLSRLGRDPAFGSGPLATVLQDLLSLLVYFTLAGAIVG